MEGELSKKYNGFLRLRQRDPPGSDKSREEKHNIPQLVRIFPQPVYFFRHGAPAPGYSVETDK